jgi:hypothetical protein
VADGFTWLARRSRSQQTDSGAPVQVPADPGGFAAAEERARWRDVHSGGWGSGEVGVLG